MHNTKNSNGSTSDSDDDWSNEKEDLHNDIRNFSNISDDDWRDEQEVIHHDLVNRSSDVVDSKYLNKTMDLIRFLYEQRIEIAKENNDTALEHKLIDKSKRYDTDCSNYATTVCHNFKFCPRVLKKKKKKPSKKSRSR